MQFWSYLISLLFSISFKKFVFRNEQGKQKYINMKTNLFFPFDVKNLYLCFAWNSCVQSFALILLSLPFSIVARVLTFKYRCYTRYEADDSENWCSNITIDKCWIYGIQYSRSNVDDIYVILINTKNKHIQIKIIIYQDVY